MWCVVAFVRRTAITGLRDQIPRTAILMSDFRSRRLRAQHFYSPRTETAGYSAYETQVLHNGNDATVCATGRVCVHACLRTRARQARALCTLMHIDSGRVAFQDLRREIVSTAGCQRQGNNFSLEELSISRRREAGGEGGASRRASVRKVLVCEIFGNYRCR